KLRDIEREIRRGILPLLIFLAIPLFATPVKIKYAEKVETVETKETEASVYLEAKLLSKLFDCNISLKESPQKFFLTTVKHSATIAPDNPFVSIDGKLFNFPIEPKIYDEELYLPLEIIKPILRTFYGKDIKKKGKSFQIYDTKITIEKIVIDPGHGGDDPGAIGPRGYPEKNAVLDIAKRVKRLIKDSLGITCILTREHDRFIPLEKRTEIANKEGADIFISIHCNAHRNRHTKGCEVYFLSPAKTNWERLVEARENASLRFEHRDFSSELKSILWDLAQNEYLHESNDLAGLLVKSICKTTGTEYRGVKQANFFVLHGAFMPAVLIEAEFISNPKGEAKLRKKEFRKAIAYGIFQGIKEFKKCYEAKMNYASE
ncbi:MAG TPA: N-acetylmuramoyl-L-alanine amidase, partial [bacterium (Candidatus Stahlbacteria)]|nr:N-acetylmuramoyl-L-alanine amidase [Candidatus Stahlbacteria bacterium]